MFRKHVCSLVTSSMCLISMLVKVCHLEYAVARLQTAIFNSGPPGQDVLDEDGARAMHRGVPGYHGEAQALHTWTHTNVYTRHTQA